MKNETKMMRIDEKGNHLEKRFLRNAFIIGIFWFFLIKPDVIGIG